MRIVVTKGGFWEPTTQAHIHTHALVARVDRLWLVHWGQGLGGLLAVCRRTLDPCLCICKALGVCVRLAGQERSGGCRSLSAPSPPWAPAGSHPAVDTPSSSPYQAWPEAQDRAAATAGQILCHPLPAPCWDHKVSPGRGPRVCLHLGEPLQDPLGLGPSPEKWGHKPLPWAVWPAGAGTGFLEGEFLGGPSWWRSQRGTPRI